MPPGAVEDCGSRPSRRATSRERYVAIPAPSRYTCPERGLSIRASALRSVDLPQAFGPMMTVKERSGISTPSELTTVRCS